MGSLALMALAVLIQVGMRVNYTQEIEMETFRAAMAESRSRWDIEPVVVQYQQFRDRQMPSPDQPFAIMPRQLTSSGSALTWATHLDFGADPDEDSEGMTVISVNGTQQRFRENQLKTVDPDAPLIAAVDRQFTAGGVVTQPNATSSSLNTGTNQSTTVILKTGAAVAGAVASGVTWNW